LATVAFALVAIAPVSADVIRPVDPTKVFFEINGTPVSEPVTFTVNCYGYHSTGAVPAPSRPPVPEIVVTFSARCPAYGCTVYEDYDRTPASLQIDSCDLEGELNGEHFIIRNFASTPVPDCTDLDQYDIAVPGGERHMRYYRTSDRYRACLGNSTALTDYATLQASCLEQFGTEVDNAALIPDNKGMPADRMCTLRFAIPPERYVPAPTPAPLPAEVVLAAIALAGGLAAMAGRKKNG
jgi:hypothetical protein